MKPLKPIVTDTYDFPTLIKRGYVYVDKTALLHRMISGVDGMLFFMSRPRRFGKSLMISTLEQIFRGNKALFKGLAISKMKYGWESHPVLRFDMSLVKGSTLAEYRQELCGLVEDAAESLEVRIGKAEQPGRMLRNLIRALTMGVRSSSC